MTLDAFVNHYDGLKVRGGQCGELVRQYWIDVDQTNPPSYVNSKDYWFNPVPGYDKVSSPQPGDIAIYNGHGAFPEGHSAIYVDGRVFEQNADPDGSPAHLFNRNNTYLLGYLHKQGENMDIFNNGDAQNLVDDLLGGGGSPYTADAERFIRAQVNGQTYKKANEAITGSAEFKEAQFVNDGDVVNIANAGGYPQEPGIKGWLWKRTFYDYLANKIKK